MSGSASYRRNLYRRRDVFAPTPVSESAATTPVCDLIPDDLPKIQPSGVKGYEVLRAVYPAGRRGEWRWELIAEASTEAEALSIVRAQKYKSVVSHPFKRGDWRPSAQPMKELPE